mmetsp:Transcript_48912/g.60128  ORF Transcript_48912/g.60128 Transcript_48912/m.60128 type:complete len:558 (+) Transcript_48912:1505-3178(+)
MSNGKYLILLILIVRIDVLISCNENLDCGSCVHYQYCSNNGCIPCTNDSECDVNIPDICDITTGYCKLKGFFDNIFDIRTISTIIVIFIGAVIAAGGGIGGGGVFVPIFILLLGLDAKSAAALSQATIFGGSIVNIIMNFRLYHPIRNHRPLTDFNTMLILVPLLLAGTVCGVLLNQILPDPIIAVILMVILIIAVYKMFKKGYNQWNKENEIRNKQLSEILSKDFEDENLSNKHDKNDQSITTSTQVFNDIEHSQDESFYTKLQQESPNKIINNNNNNNNIGLKRDNNNKTDVINSQFNAEWIEELAKRCGVDPFKLQTNLTHDKIIELDGLIKMETSIKRPLFYTGIVWITVAVFACLRTGTFFAVETCSIEYWLFEIMVLPAMIIITFIIARQEVNTYSRKLELNWIPCDGDIKWTKSGALIYSFVSLMSGLCGGLLGIGGGMIFGPLLFELGVLPRVASATSALAVMLSSSSSVLQKGLLNMLQWDYMVFFMGLGVIATFIGQTLINYAIKKYGRNSLVIFSVASIILIAIFLMGYNTISHTDWNFHFNSPCN